jgi:hypothetical protein
MIFFGEGRCGQLFRTSLLIITATASSRTEKPTHQARNRPPWKRWRDPAPAKPRRHVELLLPGRRLSDQVAGQCPADCDCGTSSPASAVEKNARAQASSTPDAPGTLRNQQPDCRLRSLAESDLRRIGVLRSLRSLFMVGVRQESDFRAIRGSAVIDAIGPRSCGQDRQALWRIAARR